MLRSSQKYKKYLIVLTVIFLYFMLHAKSYEYKAFVYLERVPPHEAGEFVADFSNMKYLNPTIVDFNIISESGNYAHWKYAVEYSEFLSHWPNLSNHAVAHFNVKSNPSKDLFLIDSVHKTCLFFGLYCLESQSEFKFMQNKPTKGTLCEEIVSYQCPVILAGFCRREVVFQRNAIMANLKKYFAKKY